MLGGGGGAWCSEPVCVHVLAPGNLGSEITMDDDRRLGGPWRMVQQKRLCAPTSPVVVSVVDLLLGRRRWAGARMGWDVTWYTRASAKARSCHDELPN